MGCFVLTDEQLGFKEMAHDFAVKEIRPIIKEWDQIGDTPLELYKKAAELGFTGIGWPEELGGMNLSKITQNVILEEIAWGDAGFWDALIGSTLSSNPILLAGTEKQKKYAAEIVIGGGMAGFALTEPNAGSDVASITTSAVKKSDEYIINGAKCFITNGPHAQYYVVFAKTDKSQGVKGISAFLVERDREGVSVGKHEDKMGIRLATASDVVFQDVRIPAENLLGKEGQGFKIAMQTLDIGRIDCAIGAIGICQSALDYSVEYAKARVTFGKPIAKFQAIQFMLADMEVRTQAARSLAYQAAELFDAGKTDPKVCACAKLFASEVAVKNALDAVQIYSGYGYSREYPVEKLVRDAKIFEIFEGTSEIQRIVISGNILRY